MCLGKKAVENEVLPPSLDLKKEKLPPPRKYEIIWHTVILFGFFHLSALYGMYLAFTSAKPMSLLFVFCQNVIALLGLTAGAHRLWSHRSFHASLPLEIALMLMNSLGFENTAMTWARDHRVHHKFTDTDADPHNAARGFFFSHIGWLLVKRHPDVIRKGRTMDFTDLYENPVLKFQRKYGIPVIGSVCFVLPTIIPMWLWGESLNNAWHVCTMMRYIVTLHITFMINSAAHLWGNGHRPYDKSIRATQNLSMTLLVQGEGYHNYHHTFPWDYRASEIGNTKWNLTTLFIDACAWLGLASNRLTTDPALIKERMVKTGDGNDLWGKPMPSMEKVE